MKLICNTTFPAKTAVMPLWQGAVLSEVSRGMHAGSYRDDTEGRTES
jgi:hypothetical protein